MPQSTIRRADRNMGGNRGTWPDVCPRIHRQEGWSGLTCKLTLSSLLLASAQMLRMERFAPRSTCFCKKWWETLAAVIISASSHILRETSKKPPIAKRGESSVTCTCTFNDWPWWWRSTCDLWQNALVTSISPVANLNSIGSFSQVAHSEVSDSDSRSSARLSFAEWVRSALCFCTLQS